MPALPAASPPHAPATRPPSAEHSRASPVRAGWRIELAIASTLALLALAVRWPHLWIVPRFTDETLEVLHSLAIVRDGARPLTNYDSYYGALHNYLLAGLFWLAGDGPFVPRLLVLAGGVLGVAATYLLGRELGASALAADPASRLSSLGPRLVGIVAALLLATNGAHVVVNSHVAWSNCLTPVFTALAFWLLLRAAGVRASRPAGRLVRITGGPAFAGGPALAAAGLVFGLALQTHPLVAALLPGVALYVLWRGWSDPAGRLALLRTPWPYLGLLLFLVGYGNVLLYNVENGFESLRSAQRIRAEYALDEQAAAGYLPTLLSMLLLLARILGGAIDQRAGPIDYLGDPFVALGCVLAAVGVGWLARRGEPLPLLLSLSFLLLLPIVNAKFQTLLTSRYLMPLVPLLFASTAAFLVHAGRRLLDGRLSAAAIQRQKGALVLGAPLAAVLLVVAPLGSLERYYARAFERGDTNERILRLSGEIASARRADEPVLVDDGIGAELPDTGVTERRGLEHLLVFARVPYRVVRISPGRLEDELRGVPSALAVLNARDAAAAAERLTVAALDPRPPAQTGRMFDYRVYRLTSRQPSAISPQKLIAGS
jgi:glycosyltransferase AglD